MVRKFTWNKNSTGGSFQIQAGCGKSEHRMDELKNGLRMERLSCLPGMADYFRQPQHIAAINLLNAARDNKGLRRLSASTSRQHLADPTDQCSG